MYLSVRANRFTFGLFYLNKCQLNVSPCEGCSVVVVVGKFRYPKAGRLLSLHEEAHKYISTEGFGLSSSASMQLTMAANYGVG